LTKKWRKKTNYKKNRLILLILIWNIFITPIIGLNINLIRAEDSFNTDNLFLTGQLNITNVKTDSGLYRQGDEADVYITIASNQSKAHIFTGGFLIREGVSGIELSDYIYFYDDIDNSYWDLNFINGTCTIRLPNFPIPSDLPIGKYFIMAFMAQLIELPSVESYMDIFSNYIDAIVNGSEKFNPYAFMNGINKIFNDTKLAISYHPSNTFYVKERSNPVYIKSIQRSALIVTNGDNLDITINTSKTLDQGNLVVSISIINDGEKLTDLFEQNQMTQPKKVYEQTFIINEGENHINVGIPISNWSFNTNSFINALNSHIPEVFWEIYNQTENNFTPIPTELFPQNISDWQMQNVTLNSSFLTNAMELLKIEQLPNILTLQIKTSSSTYGTDLFTTIIPYFPDSELFNNTIVHTAKPIISTLEGGKISQDGKTAFNISGTCNISNMETSQHNKFELGKSLFGVSAGLFRDAPTGEIYYGGTPGGFYGVPTGYPIGTSEGLVDNDSAYFSFDPYKNLEMPFLGFTDMISTLCFSCMLFPYFYVGYYGAMMRDAFTSLPEGEYWISIFTAYYAGEGALELGVSVSDLFQVEGEIKNHARLTSCSMDKDKYIISDEETPKVETFLALSPESTADDYGYLYGYSVPYNNFEAIETMMENFTSIYSDISLNQWLHYVSMITREYNVSDTSLSGGCYNTEGGAIQVSKLEKIDGDVVNLTFGNDSGGVFEVTFDLGSNIPYKNLTYCMFKINSIRNSSGYDGNIYIFNNETSTWDYPDYFYTSSGYYYTDYYYGPPYSDLDPYISSDNKIRLKFEINAYSGYEGVSVAFDRIWFEYRYAQYMPPEYKMWELNNLSLNFLELGANLYNPMAVELNESKFIEISGGLPINASWDVGECITGVFYQGQPFLNYLLMSSYYYPHSTSFYPKKIENSTGCWNNDTGPFNVDTLQDVDNFIMNTSFGKNGGYFNLTFNISSIPNNALLSRMNLYQTAMRNSSDYDANISIYNYNTDAWELWDSSLYYDNNYFSTEYSYKYFYSPYYTPLCDYTSDNMEIKLKIHVRPLSPYNGCLIQFEEIELEIRYLDYENILNYNYEEISGLATFTVIKYGNSSVNNFLVDLESDLGIKLSGLTGSGTVDAYLDPSLLYNRYAMPNNLISTGIFYEIQLGGSVACGSESLIKVFFDREKLEHLGYNINSLQLLMYNENNEEWVVLENIAIDLTSNSISATMQSSEGEFVIGLGGTYSNLAGTEGAEDIIFIVVVAITIILSIIGVVIVIRIIIKRKGKVALGVEPNFEQ